MKLSLPALVLTPMLLAACLPEEPTTPAPPPPAMDDSCGAGSYQALIGQKAPNIVVPANAAYRSYKTGDPVTMDFNPGRLNFEHDATGKLVRVSCG